MKTVKTGHQELNQTVDVISKTAYMLGAKDALERILYLSIDSRDKVIKVLEKEFDKLIL